MENLPNQQNRISARDAEWQECKDEDEAAAAEQEQERTSRFYELAAQAEHSERVNKRLHEEKHLKKEQLRLDLRSRNLRPSDPSRSFIAAV